MCGIAGVVDFVKRIPDGVLRRMLDSMHHRGPDEEGVMSEYGFVAGMRRLSIIDLTTGHQPIYNEDKTVAIFFNGEIYNYVELRRDLESRGHRFYTHSDTEVLVHCYEDQGIDFVKQLNGMFAFFLADLKAQKFYLVRDHFGIKPLYYNLHDGRLIFGSELKTVVASGLVSTSINVEALINYLNYLYVPSPKSILKDIWKLEAGHLLEISRDGCRKFCWYNLADQVRSYEKDPHQLRDEIRSLLEDSVKIQMRSDVPVGAFLSGGVDSSLITALAAKQTSIPLCTFSVGFEDSEFDELPYAREVARQYGTNHRELIVTVDDALGHLSDIMNVLDEPIGDSAILPSYLVSKLAAEHVKVVLSGLGGDELFGGYSRYQPTGPLWSFVKSLPTPLLKYAVLPAAQTAKPAWGKQIKAFLDSSDSAMDYHIRVRQMYPQMISQLVGKSYSPGFIGVDVCKVYREYPGEDEINQRMFTDIRLYMCDQLLQLTDRTSMAASLEARVPLLDRRLVELSLAIPSSKKINRQDSKIILKKAISDLLPPRILHRPKWGFASPHKSWVQGQRFRALLDQVVDGSLVREGVLNRDGVKAFLENEDLIKRHSTWVWPLVALELWYSNFFK